MNTDRLQRARKAKGLSMRELAHLAGVSAMAISKYERGLTMPSADVLARITRALDIDEAFLMREETVELRDVEYRTLHELGLSPIQEKRILADVTAQLLGAVERRVDGDYDDIETIADTLRAAWHLADLPIKNLLEVVEQHGIRVFSTEMDKGERFDGFSAVHDGAPIIVLGNGWTGDRQRFTLAHELGHHLLKGRLGKGMDEENACQD